MHSLRNIGYDLSSAIADIVDNSIDAGARTVSIDFTHRGAESWIRFVDDGCGMTPKVLDEAMRYGTNRGYGADDLGRFGLGLKTASLSQCRRLTVASRTTSRGRIAVRCWDLDQVAATDSWTLQRLPPSAAPPQAIDPLRDSTGTVVLWDRLDRLESFSNPDGRRAATAVRGDGRRVSEHLGVVFHRFLGRRGQKPQLRLNVDGKRIAGWDPFARAESETIALPPQNIREETGELLAVVRPYVLPPQAAFSSREAHEKAAGPNRWNRQQGLYIYRRERMLQCGGWSRLRTMDEHSKLARIAVDIPTATEDSWQLDVSKRTTSIPESLRSPLRTIVAGVVSHAQDVYRASLPAEQRGLDDAKQPGRDGWRLADHWRDISNVIADELSDNPAKRDKVLERLINSREANHGSDRRAA